MKALSFFFPLVVCFFLSTLFGTCFRFFPFLVSHPHLPNPLSPSMSHRTPGRLQCPLPSLRVPFFPVSQSSPQTCAILRDPGVLSCSRFYFQLNPACPKFLLPHTWGALFVCLHSALCRATPGVFAVLNLVSPGPPYLVFTFSCN